MNVIDEIEICNEIIQIYKKINTMYRQEKYRKTSSTIYPCKNSSNNSSSIREKQILSVSELAISHRRYKQ